MHIFVAMNPLKPGQKTTVKCGACETPFEMKAGEEGVCPSCSEVTLLDYQVPFLMMPSGFPGERTEMREKMARLADLTATLGVRPLIPGRYEPVGV